MQRSHTTYNKACQDRAQCSRGPRASSHCSTPRMDPGEWPLAHTTLPPRGLPALCHPPCTLSLLFLWLPLLHLSLPLQPCTGLRVPEELCSLINLAISY